MAKGTQSSRIASVFSREGYSALGPGEPFVELLGPSAKEDHAPPPTGDPSRERAALDAAVGRFPPEQGNRHPCAARSRRSSDGPAAKRTRPEAATLSDGRKDVS
jgi:hypothetical protein